MRRTLVLALGMAIAMAIAIGAIFSLGDLGAFPIYALVSLMYGLAIGLPIVLAFRVLRPRLRAARGLRAWALYLGVVAGAVVVGTLVVRAILVAAGLMTVADMWGGLLASFEISVAIGVPCTVGAFVYSRMHAQLGDSEREAQRARLASLESRTRPHFLFNALNSAIALIPEDPARAERLLERLCALLRFSLDKHVALVPLGDELDVVVDYLEIERVRFGDRLVYTLDVPEDVRAIDVPAFAVQTLVENSVKYAVSPRTQGATIVVRARRSRDRLVLEISDDGPGFVGPVWVPGHGLDGLRARLGALYGGAAKLVAPAAATTGAAVAIEVPLR